MFWVWGTAIKNYIDPWLPGNSYRHRPVVGGHRYVAKWTNEGSSIANDNEEATLHEHVDGAEKVVLVTLGYSVDDILPDCVLQAIEQTPNWVWLIRMHPINRGQAAIDEIRSKTVDRSVTNVEYELSTRLPLYTLLMKSDFHVTPFSTTCKEARALGIQSAIVHPIGGTYFKEEIENGYFGYAETADALLKLIVDSETKSSAAAPDFIETDDHLVDDVMGEVGRLQWIIRPVDFLNEQHGHANRSSGSFLAGLPRRAAAVVRRLRGR